MAIIFTEKNKNMITVSQLQYEVSLGLDRRTKTPENETQNFKTKKSLLRILIKHKTKKIQNNYWIACFLGHSRNEKDVRASINLLGSLTLRYGHSPILDDLKQISYESLGKIINIDWDTGKPRR
jgi:ribosomal protein S17E